MMKPLALSACLLCLSAVSAVAEDHAESIPKFQVFGGYSAASDEGETFHGWAASGHYNFSKWLAVGVETSGHYKTVSGASVTKNSFLIGPRFSLRRGKVIPFVYAMGGIERTKGGIEVAHVAISVTEDEKAAAIGAGIDIELSHRWAVALEADDLLVRSHGSTHGTLRFAAGIVLNIGEKK